MLTPNNPTGPGGCATAPSQTSHKDPFMCVRLVKPPQECLQELPADREGQEEKERTVTMKFEEKDRIRVLVGVYQGKEGRVTCLAPDAPKSVGVTIYGADKSLVTTWFKPEEIEKLT